MTEEEQRTSESPLRSDRGVTNINSSVVSTIAGRSAQEVEGVHMGGEASRSAGGLLENITGSESQTRGVSVEVGSVETAIDLKMGIEYGKNILGTVGEVRQKITERVQNLTGLKVTELNVTISDVIFPENGEKTPARARSRSGPDFDTRASSRRESGADETQETETGQPEAPGQDLEREDTRQVEPRSRTHVEGESGPVPEEEVRTEGRPVDEDETRRLRIEDDRLQETGSSRTGGESAGDEEAEASSSEAQGASAAEAPVDETTLTGGPDDRARETGRERGSGGEDDRTEEIDRRRVSEAEERRSRRRRRDEDG